MADDNFKCGNCFYFRDQQIMGVCRLFPEQVNKSANDWCGQHKPAQPKILALPVVEMQPEVRVKRKYTRKAQA